MEDTSRMIKKKSIKSYKNKGCTEGLSFPCFLGWELKQILRKIIIYMKKCAEDSKIHWDSLTVLKETVLINLH